MCKGALSEDYQIIVTTRDNQIIVFKNDLKELTIDLLAKPVRTLLVGNNLIVGTMNESISSYSLKVSLLHSNFHYQYFYFPLKGQK